MSLDLEAVLTLGRNLGGVIALVFYLSLVLWTWKDARRRIADPILVATAVVAAMVLPIIGVFVYMLLRPPEYLADVRERELEMRAIERSLGRQERCPTCRSFIEHDYLTCPICLTKLRESCEGCDRPIDPRWQMCPYCEADVRSGRPTPEPPRGRGRAASTSADGAADGSGDSGGKRGRSSRRKSPKSAVVDQPTAIMPAQQAPTMTLEPIDIPTPSGR